MKSLLINPISFNNMKKINYLTNKEKIDAHPIKLNYIQPYILFRGRYAKMIAEYRPALVHPCHKVFFNTFFFI